ncbi:hypothetical protein F383_05801 [Gossypium arboreum]|uniref:Uncharacterized protein n=1 Tax=Gossypium arboreum TaxID=29729 RepID=A0A0B0PHC1_GOSAR|nr:hypothetical protein F383_05801 [Gossypium arboreum]
MLKMEICLVLTHTC